MKKGYHTYWNNYDLCYKEALKYTSRYSFERGSNRAYYYALKNSWLDDYTWFSKKNWTEKDCKNEALKYEYFTDFRKKSSGAYAAALKNNWIEQYDFLKRTRKPRNYWSYDRCYKEAKRYETISEFLKNSKVAYKKSHEEGWFKDFYWLQDDRVNIITDKIDLVYVYEFTDYKTAYIGRTLIRRKKTRDYEHIFENDVVSNFAKEHNISVPQMRVLESDLTLKEGVEKEEYYVNKYKSEGWNVLNKAKTGSIGTIAKGRWTKKSCYEEALKYTTKTDFRQNSLCAYNYAKESGWLETYTWLSKKPRKLKGSRYTYEICFKLAKECTHRTDFEHKYAQAYKIAKDNNWLKDYDWFRDGRYVGWEDRKKHTYETCYNEAKKYTTMLDFYNLGKGSYVVAYREGWIKDYYWLERDRKERGYWNNYENCYNEALKYTTRVEFRYKSSRAYYSSLNHKWIDDFTWLKRTKNKKK